MVRLISTFLCLSILASTARAESYRLLSIGLYQTNDVLTERLSDASLLADYIKKLNWAASTYLDTIQSRKPAVIEIVVAFTPSGESKVWIIAPGEKFDAERGLTQELEKVAAPHAQGGPVAFCILASLWNAPDEKKLSQPGIPSQWQDAAKTLGKPAHLPDDVLPLVWND